MGLLPDPLPHLQQNVVVILRHVQVQIDVLVKRLPADPAPPKVRPVVELVLLLAAEEVPVDVEGAVPVHANVVALEDGLPEL